MEYIITLILGLLGFGIYNYKKRKSAEVDALLNETKGRDAELEIQQEDIDEAIKDLDKGIIEMRRKRKEKRDAAGNLTDEERADRWNND